MKHLLFFLILILIFHQQILSEFDEIGCGLEGDYPEYYIDMNQLGGMLITSEGILKVLVVCVRFPDDNAEMWDWPVGEAPIWLDDIIDETTTPETTTYKNLTRYFDHMSLGQFNIIGEAIYVEAPNASNNYGSPPNLNRHDATEDVLQLVVDPIINFNNYDNWTSNSLYDHENIPDGTIDMIFMIWRTPPPISWFGGGFNGEASLGYESSYMVEGGSKTIKPGYGLNSGSRVTMHHRGNYSKTFGYTVHEFGHLLGWPDLYHSHWANGGWDLMANGNNAAAATEIRINLSLPIDTLDIADKFVILGSAV